MALTVTVRNGGAVGSTTVDVTDRFRADQNLALGNRAFDGESAQSTIVLDDDEAEYGSSTALPLGLTALSVAAHNVVTVTEDATTSPTVLLRGRVIPKDIGRADLGNMGRGRQLIVHVDDYNADLKGIVLLTDQARGVETDVARVTWVLTTYLQGSPRFTTNLTDGIVNAATVSMPAKTYDAGTTILDILNDCRTAAGKTFFVMVDGTFYYAPLDDTSQRAGLRISDRLEEIDMSCPTELAASCALSVEAMTEIDTPNGGFENGDLTNWTLNAISGGLQGPASSPGDWEGDWHIALNAAGYAAYAGYTGYTFLAGQTYVVRFRVLETSGCVARFGHAGSADEAEIPVDQGAETQFEDFCLEWTPSANRDGSGVSFVIGKPTPPGGLDSFSFDSLRTYTGGGSEELLTACTFLPIWSGPASTEDGQELLSGGVLRHAEGYVTETRSAVADDYDYYVESVHDAGAVSGVDAGNRLASIIDVRQYEDRTYNVTVQLNADQVHLVMAGQMIDIKARAIPDADDAFVTRRIASLEWQKVGHETYYAVMMLDRPEKGGRRTPGVTTASQALTAVAAESAAATAALVAHGSAGDPHAGYILESLLDAKGDLITATSDNTPAKLTVGTDGHVLTADSSLPEGIKWAAGGGGGGSLTVEDEGTPLATAATTLDFVGAGVTATGAGAEKTITIPGGGSGITIEEVDGSPTATATTLKFPNGTLGIVGAVATYTPAASGGADDPIGDVFGAADTAYEFDAALSGWTNLGTATAQDADTTVPDNYYVNKAATSSVALTGIYRAVGSFPQTYITKLTDHTIASANFQRVGGLFVGEAAPGVIESIHVLFNGGWAASHVRYTNPTTFNATVGTDIGLTGFNLPLYYGLVVNSSTDVDFWYSFGGRVWRKRTDARNPAITVGMFGICVDPENATHGVAGAFDFLRVWNSAKTFPGM